MINLDKIRTVIREVELTEYGVKFLYEDFNYETNNIEHHIQLVNRTDNKIDIQVMSDNKAVQKCVRNNDEITCNTIDRLIRVFKLID